MKPPLRFDRKQSTWCLLPLHPQPQWLESLSSYMLRLAEANGLKSTNELMTLSNIKRTGSDLRRAPDYSSFASEGLATIARCSPATLRATTLYHLARHFACPTFYLKGMLHFFQESIATYLRYCPLCVAEMSYYRLSWRFLAIVGCCKHRCYLLSTCGHCGTSVPLLPHVPHVAFCATCQGDLRTCPSPLLPPQAEVLVQKRTHDLELLLMPIDWAPEITSALLQGSGFIFLRQRNHLSIRETASLMKRDEQVIREIEEGNWNGTATCADYWQYTELLGCSLSKVIEAAEIMANSERGKQSRPDEVTFARLAQRQVALPRPYGHYEGRRTTGSTN
jgi:hypothetical protein